MGVFREYVEEKPVMVEMSFRDFIGGGMRKVGKGLYNLSNRLNPQTPDLSGVKWVRDLDQDEKAKSSESVASKDEFVAKLRVELQKRGFTLNDVNQHLKIFLPKYGRPDRVTIKAVGPKFQGLAKRTFLWDQYKDVANYIDEVLSFLEPLPEE